jgi:hypothetical protein
MDASLLLLHAEQPAGKASESTAAVLSGVDGRRGLHLREKTNRRAAAAGKDVTGF